MAELKMVIMGRPIKQEGAVVDQKPSLATFVRLMNPGQRKVFNLVMDHRNMNVLVTGGAGVGKTHRT